MHAVKKVFIALASLVTIGAVALATVALISATSDDAAGGEDLAERYSTVELSTSDMVVDHEASGTVTPANSVSVGSPTQGLVVEIADLGDIVGAGDMIAVVDDQPVIVIEGNTPMWRTLTIGVEGADVEQLELALVGFGLDPSESVTVDTEYTSATADLVRDWQESVGAPATGTVGVNDIVILSAPMQVGSTATDVGMSVADGQEILLLESTRRVVTSDIAVADAAQLNVGDSVEIRLPDRSLLAGIVSTLTLPTDASVRSVTIELADPDGVAPTNGVTVSVLWSQTVAEQVVTAPADAFRRLEDGTYVIDVLSDSGTVAAIPITPGMQVGNRVEIDSAPADAQVIRP